MGRVRVELIASSWGAGGEALMIRSFGDGVLSI